MSSAYQFARRLFRRSSRAEDCGFCFDRPIVILQSDDWGRVGVRDKEGYELLREQGIQLGQHPYDFYTLETADDLDALQRMLRLHRDSTGRPPCLVMNFVMGNVDFARVNSTPREVPLLHLHKGLPGHWKRPGLLEMYKGGISSNVFYPALHGVSHFCQLAVSEVMRTEDQKAHLLRTMWRAETPYIYWRMPWVGYEFHHPHKGRGFLLAEEQDAFIRVAAEKFAKLFHEFPASACAPGYRANNDTHRAWAHWGIRVAQNGSGSPLRPHFDEFGILHVYRTIDVEPSQRELQVEKYLQLADACFRRGVPAVISVHSINFHSTLKNFRDPTLQLLSELLSALERKYSDLLYLNDADVYRIVNQGRFDAGYGSVAVHVTATGATNAAGATGHA